MGDHNAGDADAVGGDDDAVDADVGDAGDADDADDADDVGCGDDDGAANLRAVHRRPPHLSRHQDLHGGGGGGGDRHPPSSCGGGGCGDVALRLRHRRRCGGLDLGPPLLCAGAALDGDDGGAAAGEDLLLPAAASGGGGGCGDTRPDLLLLEGEAEEEDSLEGAGGLREGEALDGEDVVDGAPLPHFRLRHQHPCWYSRRC